MKVDTPDQIKEHSENYKDGAWRNYSIDELAGWVNNLSKRALHRSTETTESRQKARKDITDARNYLAMIEAHVDHREQEVLDSQ